MATKTKSFKDLTLAELRTVADAFAVDSEGNEEAIIAALVDDGISWADYQKMFHPEETPAAPVDNVVKSTDVKPSYEELQAKLAALEARVDTGIITADENPTLPGNQQWLVKMVRDNPIFEIAGTRFTQEHPYALLDASEAEVVLREEGFRQAHPSEIEEYYN